MKITPTFLKRKSGPFHVPAVIAGSFLAMLATQTHATDFVGPETVDSDGTYYWDDEENWSDGVPTEISDVVVREPVDENNEPIYDFGPTLQSDVTINSFIMEGSTQLRGDGSNFFVEGTSEVKAVINYGGEFSFGTLIDFDPVTKTLGPSPNFVAFESGVFTQPVVQFRGADVVTNHAGFQAFGPNVKFLDQDTALNALRNLATNHGILNFNDGFELATTGNLTNGSNGRIFLNYRNEGQYGYRVARIDIVGNFINQGTVELYANTVFNVSGGLSGSGSIKVLGQPCALNVVGTYLLQGGEFNFGGTGIDSFTLITTALVVESGGTITGTGVSEGSITVVSGTIAPGNSTGQIAVEGDLTLQAGATLDMEISGTTHDKISQSGSAGGTVLGGVLSLKTIANFAEEVLDESTYEILDSDVPLTGAFSNVAHGARLTTADGSGSFLVSYGPSSTAPTKVILSDYIANIVPQTYAQWAAGLDEEVNDGEDDADGDGISNLEAYFRGIPTTGPRTAKPIEVTTEEGMLNIIIRSPKTVTGVNLGSILTPDFNIEDMGPIPALVDETPTYNIYRVSVPPAGPTLFVRIRFELVD